MTEREPVEITDVTRLLPHEAPILMLDGVSDVEPGVAGVGRRLFREGDSCFVGHFPGRPVLPGVLAIEALAQTAMVVLLAEHLGEEEHYGDDLPLGYLARVHEASFRRPIAPGEEIRFEVRIERRLGSFVTVSGRATCEGALCAKSKLTLALDRRALEAALERRRGGTAAAAATGEGDR